jgi:hypothetical protein
MTDDKRLFSPHVNFLSTTKRVTKDNLSNGLSPTETLHGLYTCKTYEMCYLPNLIERPVQINFVLVFLSNLPLLFYTAIELGTTQTSDNQSRLLDLRNSRDHLVIPFDENESLLLSIRKILIPKEDDSDNRRCCLLKVDFIPGLLGPRENPSSLPLDKPACSDPDEVTLFGRAKKRPVILSMKGGYSIDHRCLIEVFSYNFTQNPPEWSRNTDLSALPYEMVIPDEANPYVLLSIL